MRYSVLFLGFFVLTGCSETASPSTYTAPVTQREVVPIERRQAPDLEADLKSPAQTESETVTPAKEKKSVPLSNDNHYINSAGNEVHSPAFAPSVPVGASARCRDGSYSFSESRRGTCSGHGGVGEWF